MRNKEVILSLNLLRNRQLLLLKSLLECLQALSLLNHQVQAIEWAILLIKPILIKVLITTRLKKKPLLRDLFRFKNYLQI